MKLLVTFSFLLSLFCTRLTLALKGGTLLSADEDQAAILADHLLVQAMKRATELPLPRSWIPNLLGPIAWGRRAQKPNSPCRTSWQ